MKTLENYNTKQDAEKASYEAIENSIDAIDFTQLEKAIVSGKDFITVHLNLAYTFESSENKHCAQLNDSGVSYNAKTNKLHAPFCPTDKLQKAFMLIDLMHTAKEVVKSEAKQNLIAEYGKLYTHNGKKFVKIY